MDWLSSLWSRAASLLVQRFVDQCGNHSFTHSSVAVNDDCDIEDDNDNVKSKVDNYDDDNCCDVDIGLDDDVILVDCV